ncbi:MAG: PIN domain-containing protein [Gammaproteobacteria bacterium]
MNRKILIDTCAWIDFLRSKKGHLGDCVSQAIENDRAVVCGVVIAELLQGAKGKKEKQHLETLFNTVECLATEEAVWFEAGNLLQTLRNKGITLPLTDALIATVAQKYTVPVMTIDKHFEHLPVKIICPTSG